MPLIVEVQMTSNGFLLRYVQLQYLPHCGRLTYTNYQAFQIINSFLYSTWQSIYQQFFLIKKKVI
jgi:hypothetical protein